MDTQATTTTVRNLLKQAMDAVNTQIEALDEVPASEWDAVHDSAQFDLYTLLETVEQAVWTLDRMGL